MSKRAAVSVTCLLAAAMCVVNVSAAEKVDADPKRQLSKPDDQPANQSKKVKVFVLMGQSNMVGMGDLAGGSSRLGPEILDLVVSVYEGPFSRPSSFQRDVAIVRADSSFYWTGWLGL